MLTAFVLVILTLGGFAVWVRVAPTDVTRWHQMPETIQTSDLANGAIRVAEGELAALDQFVRATPRTIVLTGSVSDGMITYETRSTVFGFPDYTTVRQTEGQLEIFGRARYGLKDLGVNAARIDGWLRAMRQGG